MTGYSRESHFSHFGADCGSIRSVREVRAPAQKVWRVDLSVGHALERSVGRDLRLTNELATVNSITPKMTSTAAVGAAERLARTAPFRLGQKAVYL